MPRVPCPSLPDSPTRERRARYSRIHLPGVAERTFEVYLFGDEWLSLLVEDRGYRLLEEYPFVSLHVATMNRRAIRAYVKAGYEKDRSWVDRFREEVARRESSPAAEPAGDPA